MKAIYLNAGIRSAITLTISLLPLQFACSAASSTEDIVGSVDSGIADSGSKQDSADSALDSKSDVAPDTAPDAALDSPIEPSDASDACSNQPEICDGFDNNCDNKIDENTADSNLPCATGLLGVCAEGKTQCSSGKLSCAQVNVPSAEICDSLDNDCNGKADDNDPGGAKDCDTGDLGVCKPGITRCLAGKVECSKVISPQAESCDGFDNNCDGLVDNGAMPSVGNDCTVSNQVPSSPCAKSQTTCNNGTIECSQSVFAGTELCDGKDNDCNGQTDEMVPNSACPLQNTGASNVSTWGCTAGTCAITACSGNTSDTNGQIADGCECTAPTFGNSCANATTLDLAFPTASQNHSGTISTADGSAWFKLSFKKPAMGTGYLLKAVIVDSHGGEYKMNVRTTCSNSVTCTEGTVTEAGTNLLTWQVSTKGGYGTKPSDSPAPPSDLYVEVFRVTPQTSCNTFTITFSSE